jgi:hypothetical protein
VFLVVHLDELKSYREKKHQFCLLRSRVWLRGLLLAKINRINPSQVN